MCKILWYTVTRGKPHNRHRTKRTEDRRYGSGIFQERTDAGSVEVRHGSRTLRERTPRSVNRYDFCVLGIYTGRANVFMEDIQMKTKKKIALATLAATMLATASLGIFAYAQDVAPQYAVIPCYKDECNGYARVPDPVMTNAGTGVHGTSSYLGRRCSYQWEEYTWYYTCTEGHNWSDVRRYEKNHSCSQSDGFVN